MAKTQDKTDIKNKQNNKLKNLQHCSVLVAVKDLAFVCPVVIKFC
jgi:hypothetical protein